MVMMSRLFSQITFDRKNINIGLLRLFETDRGLLYLNAGLRMVALIVVAYYFVANRSVLDLGDLRLVRLLLILFFGYSVLVGLVGVLNPEWFLRPWVKTTQAIFELSVYSLFYYLSHDPRAELYFLYFMPLFFAVHFLEFFFALGIILFGTINLYLVLSGLYLLPGQETAGYYSNHSLFVTFGLRALIMISMSLAYAVRRRASLVQELKWNRSQFGELFRSMEEGIFIIDPMRRLLFVNPILRKRHGDFEPHQSCENYFQTEDGFYEWDIQTGQFLSGVESGDSETYFTDQDGVKYGVAVSLIPLLGDTGRFNTAIAIVRDLTLQRQLLTELDGKVQTYAKQVSALNSQRILLQKTYYDLGKRLTGFEDLDSLMQVVVQETRGFLHAESASLFLLKDNVLYRKAIAGADENWLKDEHYRAGDGITGQVILPQPGAKYGRPVRNNHVYRDPDVNQRYLNEYQAQLKTRQVSHLMAVPLNGQDHSFGVLRVVNKLDSQGQLDSRGFNEEDQDFLSAIASMVAVALEKARLLKDANERYKQAVTLNAIGQKITQAADWGEMAKVIVDETRAMLAGASKSTIYLIDEPTGDLVIQACSDANPTHSGMPPLHHSQGIAGKAIRDHTAINVPDARLEPDFLDRGAADLRSLLVAPLLAGSRSIGIISVDSNRVSAFNAGDQQLLGTLAVQASLAIEKARLYQQEHERRLHSDTLLEVSRKVNSNLNINKMLPEILDELSKVVPYGSITIQAIEDNRLRVIACRGFRDRQRVMELSFPLNNRKFPNYEVIRNKSPLLVGDVREEYPHFFKEAFKYHSGHIRGWMGIPLIYREKAIGMISLDHTAPNFYTPEMASLVMTYANQVTIAIVNASLFSEKTQQLASLDSLFQASQAITSSIEIKEVLNKIVLLAKQVSQADHTGVLVLGEQGEKLDSVETHQVDVPLHQRARDGGATTQVIQTRRPVIYNRVRARDRQHNPVILQAGYKSYAGLPIIKGDRVLGVLFVHSSQPEHFHRKREIPLLQALCNHAAIAIENALLYKEAARQADMLARLVETSNELIQHTELKDLLEYCVQKAKDIFEVEDCSLYLRNRERNTIDLVHSSTIPSEVWPKRDIYLNGVGLTAFVARTGATLNFGGDEYRRHPAWSGNHGVPFEDHLRYLPSGKCHSLLISPLKDNLGENIGVLKLENRLGAEQGKKFSDFEVAMHQTFASHIGTAVERARLYQRLDKNARREARLALGYELHEIYNLIHGALVMRLEITKEKMLRNKLADVRREIENMSKAARAANSLLRWIHYDLRGDDLIEEKGLILTLEHIGGLLKVPIKMNVIGRDNLSNQIEYALYKIGVEALTNVAKHAGDQTQALITLTKHGGKFAFEVSDNGLGFDEGAVFHGTVSFGFEGMQRWAKSIGAKLDIQSKPSHGTIILVHGSATEKEGSHEG
jgi:GAF domain-containing protein/PAS domain-containing protein